MDDWVKLKRVLKYLKGTMYLGLTFFVNDIGLVTWFVDASYAVHADCKAHTGAMMTFGKGAMACFSQKQKINTRSPT